jgi:hypothetical protein
MSAKDKSEFYGVFCLYFEARVTEDNLAKLRPNADKADGSVGSNVSEMVQSVTSGDIADHDSSVLDGYTGVNSGGKGVTIDSSNSVMKNSDGKAKKDAPKGGAKTDDGSGSGGGEDMSGDIF